jgi:sorbitol/mannitol transport system permease protein
MLYTYFKEIPVDILEAARMDGASLANEIIYVLTPMAVPGIASTMLLASSCPGTKRSGRST